MKISFLKGKDISGFLFVICASLSLPSSRHLGGERRGGRVFLLENSCQGNLGTITLISMNENLIFPLAYCVIFHDPALICLMPG